jgi:hypothetical protein
VQEEGEFVEEAEGHVDVCVGIAQWQLPNANYVLEEDFKVGGEIWRVNKNDADPFPSTPHAHCISGRDRFIGCTLHLGTGELFRNHQSLGRKLDASQFQRLIELIRPKFPDIELPLNRN